MNRQADKKKEKQNFQKIKNTVNTVRNLMNGLKRRLDTQ